MEYNERFRIRLHEIKSARGYTWAEISKLSKIPVRTLDHIKNTGNTSVKNACILADVFKVSLDFLVGRNDMD